MKKSHEQFWILFMFCLLPIAAVAVAEFFQWLDVNPTVKEEMGL